MINLGDVLFCSADGDSRRRYHTLTQHIAVRHAAVDICHHVDCFAMQLADLYGDHIQTGRYNRHRIGRNTVGIKDTVTERMRSGTHEVAYINLDLYIIFIELCNNLTSTLQPKVDFSIFSRCQHQPTLSQIVLRAYKGNRYVVQPNIPLIGASVIHIQPKDHRHQNRDHNINCPLGFTDFHRRLHFCSIGSSS